MAGNKSGIRLVLKVDSPVSHGSPSPSTKVIKFCALVTVMTRFSFFSVQRRVVCVSVVILSGKHHREIKVRPHQEGELRGGSDLNCQNFREIIHSYIDRELGLVHAAEVERHLEQCDECDLIFRGQVALRSSLQDPSFYHRAPADLRQRITSYSKKRAEASQQLTAPVQPKLLLRDN